MPLLNVETVEKDVSPRLAKYEKKKVINQGSFPLAIGTESRSHFFAFIGQVELDVLTPSTIRVKYLPYEEKNIRITDEAGNDLSLARGFFIDPEGNSSILLVNRRARKQVRLSFEPDPPGLELSGVGADLTPPLSSLEAGAEAQIPRELMDLP